MMEVDDSVCDVSVRVFYGRKAALHNISLTSTTQSVSDLKTAICNTLEILADRHIIELLFLGKKLEVDKDIESYNIKHKSLVHAIVKENVKQLVPAQVSRQLFLESVKKMLNREYSYMTRKLLQESSTINNLISQSPSLPKDLVAQCILKDFDLMKLLFEPANVERIYERHPSLPAVVVELSRMVVRQADQDTNVYPQPANHTHQYRLDMSEEEDEESQPPPTLHTITTNQLAAALASAREGNQPAAASSTSSSPASQMSANSASVQGASGHSPAQNYGAQLQQLLSLGITNRNAALQALEAAGGNVDLALDIIYGSQDS